MILPSKMLYRDLSVSISIFQGTDQTLLNKLHQTHQQNKNYLRPKADINRVFGLNHFAGVVFYDSRGFLEKNRDTFSPDLLQVIQSSSNPFLTSLFQQDFYIVSFITSMCVVLLVVRIANSAVSQTSNLTAEDCNRRVLNLNQGSVTYLH